MKKDKMFYWITTGLVTLSGLIAGVLYFINPFIAKEFEHLGFPDYFRIELATAKLLGACALIFPMVNARIKEWAYAGFAIAFLSAIISNLAVDGLYAAISPFITLILLIISYVYFHKLNTRKKVNEF